jgi:hypothetical protein
MPLLLQIDILSSVGLRQDEICNMASISVVLLGLNPDTRIKPVIEYLRDRGVPSEQRSYQRALLHCAVLLPAIQRIIPRCTLAPCAPSALWHLPNQPASQPASQPHALFHTTCTTCQNTLSARSAPPPRALQDLFLAPCTSTC